MTKGRMDNSFRGRVGLREDFLSSGVDLATLSAHGKVPVEREELILWLLIFTPGYKQQFLIQIHAVLLC